ncbi:MAG: CHRD domain-containing protein [Bacteriovorax sp.]|nr:CHRD domain-containing protein [Rhizobacter sp.]
MNTSTRIVRVALLAGTVAFAACGMTPMAPMMAATNTATFGAVLSSAAEVPANASPGTGTLDATLDKSSNVLRWTLTYASLTGPATMAHFHGPAMAGANAGVAVPFPSAMSPAKGETVLTAAQVADLMAGKWYANVHTAANPGGEIRGQVMAK